MDRKIDYTATNFENVTLFAISGELNAEHEDELNLLLMRAVNGCEKAIISLKDITNVDSSCLRLFRKAYLASVRLNNPVLFTEIPKHYINDLAYTYTNFSQARELNENPA